MLISFFKKNQMETRKNEQEEAEEEGNNTQQKNEILSCDTFFSNTVDILTCQNAEDRCGYEQQHMVNDKFTEKISLETRNVSVFIWKKDSSTRSSISISRRLFASGVVR